VTRASTAIGVSPIIKEIVQKKALATRLTLKEIIYVGMLAIDELDEKRLQELADKVHQMQVNGEIWSWRKPGQTLIESALSNPVASELFISQFSNSAFWGVLCGLIIPMQPELILHMGVQKPGFYEKRRCNQQNRKKTRFRGVGVRPGPYLESQMVEFSGTTNIRDSISSQVFAEILTAASLHWIIK
jgi:hypothetical protein